MKNWSEGDIHVKGVKLHYYRTGTLSKPALLLLHGVTDSGQVWQHVAYDLENEYDIVMTDARGHGKSDRLASQFSLQLLADDIASVIQGLELHQPLVWGHSMGAITAAMLAANYPALVRAAVLEDPPLITEELKQKIDADRRATTQQPQPAPDFRSMSPEERLATAKAMHPNWHPDELLPWAESKAQVDPEVFPYIETAFDIPWRDVLARVQCPTLLVTGDPDAGAIVLPAAAQDAQKLLKQGQVVHIANSGHNIHRDNYEQAMQAIQAFLHANSPQR